MQQIEISEFEKQSIEILRNVHEAQIEYLLTSHGEPLAKLLPVKHRRRKTTKEFAQKSQILKGHAREITQILVDNKQLSAKNRQALELLHDWLLDYQPEDDVIMDEFDKILAAHPFTLSGEEAVTAEENFEIRL